MKRTLRLLCLSMLLMLGTTATHAQKCNFDEDKKDAFSGEQLRTVKVKVGNYFYSWWVLMEQKGKKYYITVQSAATGKVDDIIPKGSKMLFKLESGKVVEMATSDDCVPNHNVQGNSIISTWLPKGEVSRDVMQQLGESPLEMIRMNVGGKDFDSPSASGKAGKKMMEGAQCLLKD